MEENRTKEFEDTFHKDLVSYLEAHDLIDKHFPEAPDIEALWGTLGESYLPDALREWNHYPTVALGWMMYIGMAIAYYWDEDWERYSHVNTIGHLHVEPGTPDAFRVFIAALHEMYLMGAAMELKSLGYHMEKC